MSKKQSFPAAYSDPLLPYLRAGLHILGVGKGGTVLDPCAGTGKIFEINRGLTQWDITAGDIEPAFQSSKWAANKWYIGDATNLPFPDRSFEAVVTSPTYGSRMADSHIAKDDSVRNTYSHFARAKLGNDTYQLADNNTGKMQWGDQYRETETRIFEEVYRVVEKGLVLNIKNHVRNHSIEPVAEWHCVMLEKLGFKHKANWFVKTPGLRFGENDKARVEGEWVIVWEK